MNLRRAAVLSLSLLTLSTLSACTAETRSDENVASSESALFFYRGFAWDLFGISLNGRGLNGNTLTGKGVLGVSYSGATLGKNELRSVWLEGTTLHATGPRAGMGGRALVGAVFSAKVIDGDTLPLRIDAVEASSNPMNRDLQLYTVSYQTDASWQPLCGTDAQGHAVRAIPLAGRWDYRSGVEGGGSHIEDPSMFTFACEGYAIAKCVDLGYRPLGDDKPCNGGGAGCSLMHLMDDMHQACTRAMRADYCGDGTSYTHDAVTIDIYDGFGYRTPMKGWPFEAEWNAAGAVCANQPRVPPAGTPTCWSRLQREGCGKASHFKTGTLLMSQISP